MEIKFYQHKQEKLLSYKIKTFKILQKYAVKIYIYLKI